MIIFIRHGQTTANAEGLLVGRSDPHLTALGERQARALAPYLEGVQEVWVSPLARARETATLALPDFEPATAESFIEVDYGDLDGLRVSDISPNQWRAFEDVHDAAIGGGESLAAVDGRVHAQLESLLFDSNSLLHSSHRHLAIVSHVSPIKSAVVWALGVAPSTAWRTRLDNGSITTIAARAGTPQLVRFNMVPALS
ncbi:MAG: fructose-2,6-bisphosphatase [Acidimicrobiaceae bacterium]|nr:fructose-2,6-bisphosphatase [Acidimicrobiaceae bacterium]